jgi:hypothetical protein
MNLGSLLPLGLLAAVLVGLARHRRRPVTSVAA